MPRSFLRRCGLKTRRKRDNFAQKKRRRGEGGTALRRVELRMRRRRRGRKTVGEMKRMEREEGRGEGRTVGWKGSGEERR